MNYSNIVNQWESNRAGLSNLYDKLYSGYSGAVDQNMNMVNQGFNNILTSLQNLQQREQQKEAARTAKRKRAQSLGLGAGGAVAGGAVGLALAPAAAGVGGFTGSTAVSEASKSAMPELSGMQGPFGLESAVPYAAPMAQQATQRAGGLTQDQLIYMLMGAGMGGSLGQSFGGY